MAQFQFNPLATVNPSAAPTPGFSQRANADAFGGQIGREAEGLAKVQEQTAATLAQVGDVANKHLLAFNELNNETEAKQGDTTLQAKLRGIGFGGPDGPGYFASAGQNAYDGAQPTMEAAQKAYDEVMGGLSNEGARRMFRNTGMARINSFSESVASHGAQGRKEWMLGTSVARQASAKDNAVDFYNDDVKIDTNIAVAKSEDLAQGELQGWSPEQTIQAQQKTASNIRVAVIDRKLTADPMGAQAYYQAHMDEVDPAVRAKVERELQSAVIPVQVSNLVKSTMRGGAVPNPDVAATVAKGGLPYAAIAMAESGGRDFNKDGTVVTSPKGAKAAMQVMDGTNESPGFGVMPARNGSVEERNRVGRDYYGAMLARYGDQSLALSAYNAGPGKVDAALVRMGSAPGQQVDAARVVAMMPAETRDYVAKVNAASPPTVGHMPTSDDVRNNLGAWTENIRTAAEQAYPNNPAAQKMAIAELDSQAAQIIRGQNYAEKAGQNALLARVYGLGTMPDGTPVQLPMSKRPQNLQELLADPASAAAWRNMDSIQQAAVLSRLGHDDNPTTTGSEILYHQLDGLSHTDPVQFGNINFADPKYVDALPKSRIAALMGVQQKLLTTQGSDAAKAQNWNWAMGIAKTAPGFKEAGIPLSATAKGVSKAAAERYQQFGSRLSEQVQQYQADHKKLPTPDEVRGMTNNLLMSGTVPATGWLSFMPGLHTTTQAAYQSDPSKFDAPIPDASRARLVAQYKDRHGVAPTDSQVADIWRTHRLRTGQQ